MSRIALMLLLVLPATAVAQTSGSLSPLTLIAQFESTYGTNTVNVSPGSSASGIFQDQTGTWAQALSLCACGTTAQYPTAGSAPTSLQFAANAALYNADGFGPWTCPGCDPPLAAALAADGGAGAFPTNLSTNPADYASVDASGGLASYFTSTGGTLTAGEIAALGGTGGGGTPGITVTAPGVGTGSGTGTMIATVSSTPGTLSSAFTWMWNNTLGTVQSAVSGLIGDMQSMVADYLTPLLFLSTLVLAYQLFVGQSSYSSMMTWMVRVSMVVMLTAVGSTFYTTYVVQPVMNLPGWWQSYIGGTGTGSTPVSLLDSAYNAVWGGIEKMAETASPVPWKWGHDILIFVLATATIILIDVGLFLMFLSIWATTLLSYVALALGPVVIPFAVFPLTRSLVWQWAWAIGTLLCTLLSVDLVLSLWQTIIKALFAAASISGNPDVDAPSEFQLAFVVFAMGTTMAGVTWLAGRIFSGAVETGLAGAAYWLGGQAAVDGAKAVGRAGSRAVTL
jgi:TrbL/VirB6 plasmid conjugal transfer protein